jgi:hypothetical protein
LSFSNWGCMMKSFHKWSWGAGVLLISVWDFNELHVCSFTQKLSIRYVPVYCVKCRLKEPFWWQAGECWDLCWETDLESTLLLGGCCSICKVRGFEEWLHGHWFMIQEVAKHMQRCFKFIYMCSVPTEVKG